MAALEESAFTWPLGLSHTQRRSALPVPTFHYLFSGQPFTRWHDSCLSRPTKYPAQCGQKEATPMQALDHHTHKRRHLNGGSSIVK